MRVIEGGKGRAAPGTTMVSVETLPPVQIEDASSLDRALCALTDLLRIAYGPGLASAKLLQAGYRVANSHRQEG